MTAHYTSLREAIQWSLFATAMLAAGHAAAADTNASTNAEQDKPEAQLDRIVVTGSHIRQVDVETQAPVQTITRAEIEKQGFKTVADILQNIPAVGTPPLSRARPLVGGEAAGGSYVDLRNLGAERTLVLVNGRRLGVTTSGLADTSSIPASVVERIDVLKDGASAVYGSDAIAGVINIITRRDIDALTASAYVGQYSQGDGQTRQYDVSMGSHSDKSSLAFAAEWGNEDRVAASDRPFSAFPRSDIHPTDGWTLVSAGGGFVNAGVRSVLRPGGNSRVLADFVPQDRHTGDCTNATPQTGCEPGLTADKSNPNQQMDLRTPRSRRALFVDGTYDFNENLRLRANVLYNRRIGDQQFAGYPLQASGAAAPLSANSYFTPTPGTAIGNWWRRTWEVPRRTRSDLTTVRVSVGLDGSFELADRQLDWDIGYLDNSNVLQQSSVGNINLANLRAAVGPSFLNAQGHVQCGTSAAPIGFDRCTPFNPFLGYGRTGEGALTGNDALRRFLFPEEHSRGETRTTALEANLSGNLFALPAGDLGFALGYEHRKESGRFTPDALAVSGGSTSLAAGPTRGDYTVNSAYAELQIPILADVLFAKSLSLDVASRHSRYSTFGNNTSNMLGLKWKPIDALLIRATYAGGFRAPTIADLYGGGSQTFSRFTDPCDTVFGSSATNPSTRARCVAAMGAQANTFRQLGQGLQPVGSPNSQTPVPFNFGSNPLLTPEQSRSMTMGAVWSPDFAPGLYASLDWWKIRVGHMIVGDSPTSILEDCYVRGIASRCSPVLFTRNTAQGYVDTLHFGSKNAGFTKTEGFDVGLGYKRRTERFGSFALNANATYVSRYEYVGDDTPIKVVSSVGQGDQFRIRANASLDWQYRDFGVNWNVRYYSSMSENCTYRVPDLDKPSLECNRVHYAPNGNLDGTTSDLTYLRHVGSNTFHDVQVRWNAPWDATVSLGANNVFGHVGPVMYAPVASDTSYYGGFDIGRFVYMKYTQKF